MYHLLNFSQWEHLTTQYCNITKVTDLDTIHQTYSDSLVSHVLLVCMCVWCVCVFSSIKCFHICSVMYSPPPLPYVLFCKLFCVQQCHCHRDPSWCPLITISNSCLPTSSPPSGSNLLEALIYSSFPQCCLF